MDNDIKIELEKVSSCKENRIDIYFRKIINGYNKVFWELEIQSTKLCENDGLPYTTLKELDSEGNLILDMNYGY